jgi:AcrR family transcriptional regulator
MDEARARGVDRRAVIRKLSALIAEHGIDGTSMRDIGRAAGLSTGTLNYHFGSKRGLVIAAMDSVYALPEDWEAHAHLPAMAQLRRMERTFILDNETLRRWWRFWIEYMAHAARDDELRARHEQRYTRQHRFYARIIRSGIEAGELRRELGPNQASHALLATANGLAVHQVVVPALVTPARARELLDAHLSALEAAHPDA